MFSQNRKSPARRKLYSIHGLLAGRQFKGEIESGKLKHQFAFTPTSASLADGKFEFSGDFAVKTSGKNLKTNAVKATLLGTQGSLLAASTVPAGGNASMLGDMPAGDLPATDASGAKSSVGVAYFKLSSLDGDKMGLPFDMSAVQLNLRLNPGDEFGRVLQFWLSVVAKAVGGESKDMNLASESVAQINHLLKV